MTYAVIPNGLLGVQEFAITDVDCPTQRRYRESIIPLARAPHLLEVALPTGLAGQHLGWLQFGVLTEHTIGPIALRCPQAWLSACCCSGGALSVPSHASGAGSGGGAL